MNVFRTVSNWATNSRMVIVLFATALAVFMFTVMFSREDAYSSVIGIQGLSRRFGLAPATSVEVVWAMAWFLQVAGWFLALLKMSDTESRKWEGRAAFVILSVDAFADTYQRSNGQIIDALFEPDARASALLALGFTLFFFTFANDLLMMLALGVMLNVGIDALRELIGLVIDLIHTLIDIVQEAVAEFGGGDRGSRRPPPPRERPR